MDGTTKQEILDTIQLHPNSTVEELARLLHLTRADIRYHLNGLKLSGQIVQMAAQKHPDRLFRGRPAKTYQLSATGRPDLLSHFAHILLTQLQQANPEGWISQLASNMIPPRGTDGSETHISQQLNLAINTINSYPYQARWEVHANGPQVFFHNCPFAAVIDQHPELCQMDRNILQNLTGQPARQIKKIDLHGPTAPACVFVLSGRPDKN